MGAKAVRVFSEDAMLPTARAVSSIVRVLRDYADEIEHLGNRMLEEKDFGYVSEVLQSVTNMNGNLRLDLLVTRPLREFKKGE